MRIGQSRRGAAVLASCEWLEHRLLLWGYGTPAYAPPRITPAGDSQLIRVLSPGPQTSLEGTPKSFLMGGFSDMVSANGPWSMLVNWGDGSLPQGFQVKAQGTLPQETHTYANNRATPFAAVVSVTGPQGEKNSASFHVSVFNVAPSNIKLSLTNSLIGEGDSTSLSGTFSDPGTKDTHQITVSWGDGATSPLALGAGVLKFSGLSHKYLDNLPGDAPYSISVNVTDSDKASAFSTIPITVVNQFPSNVKASLTSPTIATGKGEGLTGSFFDPGTLDSHEVIISWGDQTNTTLSLKAGLSTFGATHIYTNTNPAGGAAMIFNVEVSVLDSDSLPTYAGPTKVDSFQFSQVSFADQNAKIYDNNSLWGRADFDTLVNSTLPGYLNIVAEIGTHKAWVVQNLPLDPGYNHQSVDIDLSQLGITDGTAIHALSFFDQISQTIISAQPTGSMTSATVANVIEQPGNDLGMTSGAPPKPGTPTGVKIQGKIDPKNTTPERTDVPAVQEALNQCMPGAFARSLGWLNVAHGLGFTKKVNGKTVPRTAQEIYDALVSLLGDNTDGQRLMLKADALAAQAQVVGKKAQTKLFDPNNKLTLPKGNTAVMRDNTVTDLVAFIKRELDNGEDVELDYALGANQGNINAHILTIVRLITTDSGVYVEYRDDAVQKGAKGNGDAGIKTAQLVPDGKGGYTFRRSDKDDKNAPPAFTVNWAVSESLIDTQAKVTAPPKK